MTTGNASLPVLAEAIAGRQLAGSWMAHPEAARIYHILGELRKYDLIRAPLVLSKEVVMGSSLGPAVERIASDRDRRERVLTGLPPLARKLLGAVEATGQVRMDRWEVPTARARPARLVLERELLVVGSDVHTQRGYHTSIVTPWEASAFSQRFSHAAAQLGLEEAQDHLLLAAVRAAVIAPEREVRRWFVFGAGQIEALVAEGQLQRLRASGRTWLTCAFE